LVNGADDVTPEDPLQLVLLYAEKESPKYEKAALRWLERYRHTAITNDAAAGANPTALMTKAGHSDMRTTKTYLHLAGVVFREEAERLEARLLGVEGSTPLSESESTEHDPRRVTMRSGNPAN
jgi:hypothetical protein